MFSVFLYSIEKWPFHHSVSYFLLGIQERFGNNSNTVSLIIDVQDYDTLNPYFSQSVYNGTISENEVKAFH